MQDQYNEPLNRTTTDLIELAANQSIQEEAETNGGVEVVKKVNLNFGNMKLNDSKKRVRNSGMQSQGFYEVQMKSDHQSDMQISNDDSENGQISSNNSGGNIFMSGGGNSDNNEFSRKIHKAKRYKP